MLVKILKFFDADPDLGSGNLFDPGSGMEKIEIFWVKILKFFDADPASGNLESF